MNGFEHYIRPLISTPKPWHMCDYGHSVGSGCTKQPSYKCGYQKCEFFGESYPVRHEFCSEHAKEFSEKHKLEFV